MFDIQDLKAAVALRTAAYYAAADAATAARQVVSDATDLNRDINFALRVGAPQGKMNVEGLLCGRVVTLDNLKSARGAQTKATKAWLKADGSKIAASDALVAAQHALAEGETAEVVVAAVVEAAAASAPASVSLLTAAWLSEIADRPISTYTQLADERTDGVAILWAWPSDIDDADAQRAAAVGIVVFADGVMHILGGNERIIGRTNGLDIAEIAIGTRLKTRPVKAPLKAKVGAAVAVADIAPSAAASIQVTPDAFAAITAVEAAAASSAAAALPTVDGAMSAHDAPPPGLKSESDGYPVSLTMRDIQRHHRDSTPPAVAVKVRLPKANALIDGPAAEMVTLAFSESQPKGAPLPWTRILSAKFTKKSFPRG